MKTLPARTRLPIAAVMSGGGARAAYQIGILRAKRERENDRRRNPARTQPIHGPASHETDVGRSSAIRYIEAALMHQPGLKAAPRTGQLKSAADVSRRARPRRECWAVGTLLADPWLLERDVHTVGRQVESQPARL